MPGELLLSVQVLVLASESIPAFELVPEQAVQLAAELELPAAVLDPLLVVDFDSVDRPN